MKKMKWAGILRVQFKKKQTQTFKNTLWLESHKSFWDEVEHAPKESAWRGGRNNKINFFFIWGNIFFREK